MKFTSFVRSLAVYSSVIVPRASDCRGLGLTDDELNDAFSTWEFSKYSIDYPLAVNKPPDDEIYSKYRAFRRILKAKGIHAVEVDDLDVLGRVRHFDPEDIKHYGLNVDKANTPSSHIVLIRHGLTPELLLTTLLHETAHVYAGHIGNFESIFFEAGRELEAELVSYLFAKRLGVFTPHNTQRFLVKHGQPARLTFDRIVRIGYALRKMTEAMESYRHAG